MVSGVTMIPGMKCKDARVIKKAIVDPIASNPNNCLANPLTTVRHFLYTHPMLTALDGPRKGAMHMEAITTGTLLASRPPVARSEEAKTRTK